MSTERVLVRGYMVITHRIHGLEGAANMALDNAEFFRDNGCNVRLLCYTDCYIVVWSENKGLDHPAILVG